MDTSLCLKIEGFSGNSECNVCVSFGNQIPFDYIFLPNMRALQKQPYSQQVHPLQSYHQQKVWPATSKTIKKPAERVQSF
jgi:hypothetical protein